MMLHSQRKLTPSFKKHVFQCKRNLEFEIWYLYVGITKSKSSGITLSGDMFTSKVEGDQSVVVQESLSLLIELFFNGHCLFCFFNPFILPDIR